MKGIGTMFKVALGYISVRAIASFGKASIKLGSDVAEIENVVNVTFGEMKKDIEEFADSAMENFGLTQLAAKKYTSTMGAMLKSSGLTGEAMKEMSIDLTRLTADMASFHNLETDEVFEKIMSGMSGMTMPLKKLGINMNIVNLEAYALTQGIKKSYQQMSQGEQIMLRYNYLMQATGDMHGDFSRNAHNWAHTQKILSGEWKAFMGIIGQGLINALQPLATMLVRIVRALQAGARAFRDFTTAVFGYTQASRGISKDLGYLGDNLGDVEDGLGGVGKAGKKAGKDLKGALAGFDELNILADKASSGAGGLADELGGIGGVGPVDLGTTSSGSLDIDTSKFENKFKNLKSMLEDFYTNWGMKDVFKGFRDGLDLINFDNIKTNLQTAFSGLGEIAQTHFLSLQPIFSAAGQTLGTMFKYGIAMVGNFFEPITLGRANFMTNMKVPIQEWIEETSQTITNGFNNLSSVFEIIGQSWLESINKFKEPIAKAMEDTMTVITETFMLIDTVSADIFEIITGKAREFYEENKEDIQKFTDSILGIFADVWGLINTVWTDTLDSLKVFWDNWGKDIVNGVMNVVKDIEKWFLYLWNDLVKPTWDVMLKWLTKIWDESLKGIVDELLGFVGRVGDLITKLWDGVLQPLIDKVLKTLVPAFKESRTIILDVVGTAVNGIGGIIKNLLKILNGIIDFVVGVFTGDWKRAWEGVSNVFKGIVDGLVSIFKIPLNLIITGINSFIRGINGISIPDWVPGVGGKGFSIREIPHLAKGGIVDSPTLAMIGEKGKEAVVPLENTSFVTTLASAIANEISKVVGNNKTPDNNGDVVIRVGESDFARIAIKAINEAQRSAGTTLLTV